MLCQFLLYRKVVQLDTSTYSLFFRFFSEIGHYRVLSRVPYAVQQVFITYLIYIQQCVHIPVFKHSEAYSSVAFIQPMKNVQQPEVFWQAPEDFHPSRRKPRNRKGSLCPQAKPWQAPVCVLSLFSDSGCVVRILRRRSCRDDKGCRHPRVHVCCSSHAAVT